MMMLTDLVAACAAHPPTAIVLAPEDFHHVMEFAARLPAGEWLISAGGVLTYRGAPIVRSREWQRSYLVEDTSDGPQIHMVG